MRSSCAAPPVRMVSQMVCRWPSVVTSIASTMLRMRNRPQPRGLWSPSSFLTRSGASCSSVSGWMRPPWSVIATTISSPSWVTLTSTGISGRLPLPCSIAFMVASATAVFSRSSLASDSPRSFTVPATLASARRSFPGSLASVNVARLRGATCVMARLPPDPLIPLLPRGRRALERYQRDVVFLLVIRSGEGAELRQAQVDKGLPRGSLADQLRDSREAEHLPVRRVRLGQPVAVQQGAVAGLELEGLFLVVHAGHQPERHAAGSQLLHAVPGSHVRHVVA